MRSTLRKLRDLYRTTDNPGRISMLIYMAEIALYRVSRKRLRTSFAIKLYGLNFIIKPHNTDLGIIYEIFEERIYEQFPDFNVQDGFVCVDIGANIGCVSLFWGQRNATGKILALEPHPETFARLKTNITSNNIRNIEILPYAATRASGDITLNIADHSSMAITNGSDVENFAHSKTVIVAGCSLDDLYTTHHFENVDILKIDIEGYEAECLKGGATALQKTQRLIIEYHSSALYEECSQILRQAGFIVCDRNAGEVGLIFAQKLGLAQSVSQARFTHIAGENS